MQVKVYALHIFEPQNEDELSFKPGEVIEVMEKDDEFGDGWWLGKNLDTGAVGLFPQSYTANEPLDNESLSSTPSNQENGSLTPLNEVSEPSMTPPHTAKPLIPAADSNRHTKSISISSIASGPTATDGDVQRAMESLSGEDEYSMRSRADSVVSMSIEDDPIEATIWDKDARKRLAEEARKAVEQMEKEDPVTEAPPIHQQTIAPPIHIEMSDTEEDSEPEEEERGWYERSSVEKLPPSNEPEPERASFGAVGGRRSPIPTPEPQEAAPTAEDSRTPIPEPKEEPISPSTTATSTFVSPSPVQEPAPQSPTPQPEPAPTTKEVHPPTNPSSWALSDVLSWVRSKNFGEDVVDKFVEQDITGDVLLELDAKTLKEEIGILAFGKRVRIANAITELKVQLQKEDEEKKKAAEKEEEQKKLKELDLDLLTPITSQFGGSGSGSASMRSFTPIGSIESPTPEKRESGAGQRESVRRRLFGRDSKGEVKLEEKRGSRASSKDAFSPVTYDELGQPIVPQGPPSPASPMHKRQASIDSNGRDTSSKKGKTTGTGAREPSSTSPSTHSHRSSIFGSFGPSHKTKRKEVPKYKPTDGAVSDSEASPSGGGFGLSMFSSTSKGSTRPSTPKGDKEEKPNMLRKRTSSYAGVSLTKQVISPISPKPRSPRSATPITPDHVTVEPPKTSPVASPNGGKKKAIEQIGEPDYKGWLRKKAENYGGWKLRFLVLKEKGLYILRSENETKVKVFIDVSGYKVLADENLNPGKYGFRIEHENLKPYYFSSDDKLIIRGWMKAIMKATIGRDYTKPVMSSANMPTIPLVVAQAMNPPPRPPSPGERGRMQKEWRERERKDTPGVLSSRDARVLMGEERVQVQAEPVTPKAEDQEKPFQELPPRPSRSERPMRQASVKSFGSNTPSTAGLIDGELVDWANGHLPSSLVVTFSPPSSSQSTPITGLHILRIAENVKGTPSSPAVPDSAFPPLDGGEEDKLEGFFKLFDFLLDNDVKIGNVSINDVRNRKTDKIAVLLRGIKEWESRLKAGKEKGGYNGPTMAVGGFPGLG